MNKLLIVDDDDALRNLMRLNLSDTYEIVDTGKPEEALELALEHRPDAILLDLRMPKFSGFQLSQALSSFCTTRTIPFFVVSGDVTATTKDYCRALGAAGYFEKPVDFEALRARLAKAVRPREVTVRTEVRVNLHVPLRLCGTDAKGKPFRIVTTTDDASISGFLCRSTTPLEIGSVVDVFLAMENETHVGKAQVVRSEAHDTPAPRYGFRFAEKTGKWVLE
ncbi:MAG: response regulator [Candidatus Acidiferrales bacterium]|jgi:DNA-binding response OmpR family regulator